MLLSTTFHFSWSLTNLCLAFALGLKTWNKKIFLLCPSLLGDEIPAPRAIPTCLPWALCREQWIKHCGAELSLQQARPDGEWQIAVPRRGWGHCSVPCWEGLRRSPGGTNSSITLQAWQVSILQLGTGQKPDPLGQVDVCGRAESLRLCGLSFISRQSSCKCPSLEGAPHLGHLHYTLQPACWHVEAFIPSQKPGFIWGKICNNQRLPSLTESCWLNSIDSGCRRRAAVFYPKWDRHWLIQGQKQHRASSAQAQGVCEHVLGLATSKCTAFSVQTRAAPLPALAASTSGARGSFFTPNLAAVPRMLVFNPAAPLRSHFLKSPSFY